MLDLSSFTNLAEGIRMSDVQQINQFLGKYMELTNRYQMNPKFPQA